MMRIDGKFRNLEESRNAFERVKREFFDPYPGLLSLGGIDGIEQVWQGDMLLGLKFPTGFGARDALDVSATQHEMGHFVSISLLNSVRKDFGFNGGIPLFGFNAYSPDSCVHVSPASANVEAKAMAWEIILSRDLHGLEIRSSDISKSLVYADDFLTYQGDDGKAKLRWVTGLIEGYVADFGSADDFRRLWHDRCSMLPDLLGDETARMRLMEQLPATTESVGPVHDGWSGVLEHRTDGSVSSFTLVMTKDEPEEWELGEAIYRVFDTPEQASRWVQRVREAHAFEPDAPSPSM